MCNNLHIYFPSHFQYESRILKETNSILNKTMVDHIYIAAFWKNGLLENEAIDSNRSVIRLKTGFFDNKSSKLAKIYQFLIASFKLILRFKSLKINVVNCHSLSILPLGVILKYFFGIKLIYDPHELETEKNGLSGLRKRLFKITERLLISKVDATIVVCKPIGDWYRDSYNLKNIYVVRNMPLRLDLNTIPLFDLKIEFSIPKDHILFLYQGLLTPGRGVEKTLNLFQRLDKKRHILFMGYGDMEPMIRKYANEFENIHFKPAVKPHEIMSYTSSADIGIFVPDNSCLSYYLSLPNKYFEYIIAEVPLIVNNWPCLKEWINEYDIGWLVEEDLLNYDMLFNNISLDEIKEKRANMKIAKENVGWELDEHAYEDLYNGLIKYE